ncbi:hypothetical protein BU26DRAFT_64979 [Trematosphaeria pertusa]|uniref:Uncharacterized protein n=1 Tax=Trematosphaeria pertusa TaxID=390896 RepID=A0A6A6I832_9PLEO|nr:uncharacterized protein BU26DRAFT_64979 [Trematosphaeria pertusa]KAF2246238.1 hypothetical protein BU26DRAFT_64979 [Trematosphaeria pertusa]
MMKRRTPFPVPTIRRPPADPSPSASPGPMCHRSAQKRYATQRTAIDHESRGAKKTKLEGTVQRKKRGRSGSLGRKDGRTQNQERTHLKKESEEDSSRDKSKKGPASLPVCHPYPYFSRQAFESFDAPNTISPEGIKHHCRDLQSIVSAVPCQRARKCHRS